MYFETFTGLLRCSIFPSVGLIIDAFGELRDQQEQVKEDMEVQYKRDLSLPPQYVLLSSSPLILRRQNALYVGSEVTTSIQRRTALRLTL